MGRKRELLSLAELLDDPVTELVMKSDGIDRRSLELLFERLTFTRPRRAGPPSVPEFAPAPC